MSTAFAGSPQAVTGSTLVVSTGTVKKAGGRNSRSEPGCERVQQAIHKLEKGCRWEHAGQPFFAGEVEPCINGRVVTIGTYFGFDMSALVERLFRRAACRWRLELRSGEWLGSFLVCLHGSMFWKCLRPMKGQAVGRLTAKRPRRKERNIFSKGRCFGVRRLAEVVNPAWLQFSFPARWHFDVLRGLDYFRATGGVPDKRLEEAVQLLRSKQQADHRWLFREYPSRPGPFRSGAGRWRPESLEYAPRIT